MLLTPRFDQALQYATVIHAGQKRKGTEIPYISHLLGVASIAMEHGADEDETIGALLHDAGEDAGGAFRINDIRQRFGPRVADIVLSCTDTLESPKPEWRERKEKYIAHLSKASASARLVSASDKLHNARSLLLDYRIHGDDIWAKFKGGKDGTLWYYRELVKTLRDADDGENRRIVELIAELARVVSELAQLAAGN